MNILKLSLALLLAHSLTAQGQVTRQVQQDLEAAQSRLLSQRADRAEARIELGSALTEKQSLLLTQRRQASISRRTRADNEAFLSSLRNKNFASTGAVEALNESLRGYGIQMQTRHLPGEAADPRLDAAFTQSDDPNEALTNRLALLELGLERLENALGGQTIEGEVTTEEAELVRGEVIAFGPARWFVSDDKSQAGSYALSKSGQVATLDPEDGKTALALQKGETAQATLDITGGKARALAAIKSGPIDLIKKGGAWVYPILLLAFAALFCAIRKVLELRKVSEPGDTWLQEVVSLFLNGQKEEALTRASEANHPIGRILPATMEAASHNLAIAEDILFERMITVKEQLRGWLPFIAVTAATAPLLGLLGTVSGLIRTFRVIAVEGTGEAQSISGGISEALITTLFGLTVAIPAFMAHALLARKAKGIEQNTERMALSFLNQLRKQR